MRKTNSLGLASLVSGTFLLAACDGNDQQNRASQPVKQTAVSRTESEKFADGLAMHLVSYFTEKIEDGVKEQGEGELYDLAYGFIGAFPRTDDANQDSQWDNSAVLRRLEGAEPHPLTRVWTNFEGRELAFVGYSQGNNSVTLITPYEQISDFFSYLFDENAIKDFRKKEDPTTPGRSLHVYQVSLDFRKSSESSE